MLTRHRHAVLVRNHLVSPSARHEKAGAGAEWQTERASSRPFSSGRRGAVTSAFKSDEVQCGSGDRCTERKKHQPRPSPPPTKIGIRPLGGERDRVRGRTGMPDSVR